MQTMRANVFCGVDDIRVEEVPRPRAGIGEAATREADLLHVPRRSRF